MKKLAIIVPYRDRKSHLNIFIPYIHYCLKSIDYKVIIVEQEKDTLFNRGMLFNIGFKENENFDYYCFHDVDSLPINYNGLYDYSDIPINLIGRFLDSEVYPAYYGGVSLFSKQSFEKINGFSNEYEGWGAEDDDLRNRVLFNGFSVVKRSGVFLRLSHPHVGAKNNPNYDNNYKKLNSSYDYSKDGLSSLKYKIIDKNIIDEKCHIINVNLWK